MLTKQQRVYRWIKPGSSISSDRLGDKDLPHLARAIAVYRRSVGRRRGRVRDAARAALGAVQPDRVEGLVKLLDDAATYEWPRGMRQAEQRVQIFKSAARGHPVLERDRALDLLKVRFDPAPRSLEDAVPMLYADYPEFHRLVAFPADYTAGDLRADYDLAQAQALLYDAVRITVESRRNFRHIVQYARLSRLLHRVERLRGGAYRLAFDGPNSILRHTHAYGVDFAKFLAALVQIRGWTLTAEVVTRKGWRPVTFALSDADGLRSRVPAPVLFDSRLEETFARKFGPKRGGWSLGREAIIIEAGEALVVPDFVFTHEDGTEVAMEIVGYWTPEYLKAKLDKLAAVQGPNLIVAVRKAMAVAAGCLPATVLPFSSGILLRDLMPHLEAFRPALKRSG